MADTTPVTALLDEQKRHILNQTANSLFYIEVSVKHQEVEEYPDALRHYMEILERLRGISVEQNSIEAETGDEEIPRVDPKFCTGFGVESPGDNGNAIFILTTAHAISSYFCAGKHFLTPKDLNNVFIFNVMCIHQERRLLSLQTMDDPSGDLNRIMSYARAVAVNTELDLLLLKVDRRTLWLNYIDDDNFTICSDQHLGIPIATQPAVNTELVLLQGWPELRSETSIWGNVSETNRLYDTVTKSNDKGYRMRLIEIPKFQCPATVSGGPIVSKAASYVGVYHGIINKSCKSGYAISYEDLVRFIEGAFENCADEDDDDE